MMVKDELSLRLEEAVNHNKELFKENISIEWSEPISPTLLEKVIKDGTLYFVDDYDNSPNGYKVPVVVYERDGKIKVRIIKDFRNLAEELFGDYEGPSFTIDKNPFNMKSAEFNGKSCGVLIERPDGSKEMISVLRG